MEKYSVLFGVYSSVYTTHMNRFNLIGYLYIQFIRKMGLEPTAFRLEA